MHTKECLDESKKAYEEAQNKHDESRRLAEARGIDMSGRGWGYTWLCFCKTQETTQ